MMKKSRISIVGAGPGAEDLITLRGLKAIQTADAILYDALVNRELLKEAPQHAQLLFVGKRAGQKCKSQSAINLLLVEYARRYGHAVRLKGGDPFIFGRGHEELEYARSQRIHTTVVPGLSSASSLPLLQEVPLTKRGINESFWVITGSTRHHGLSADIAFAAKSTATLVILMGIRKLPIIREILMNEGKQDLPIMIIEKGSSPDERVLVSTVRDIVNVAREANVRTPGIIVAGETVGLHPAFIKHKVLATWSK